MGELCWCWSVVYGVDINVMVAVDVIWDAAAQHRGRHQRDACLSSIVPRGNCTLASGASVLELCRPTNSVEALK